MEAGRATSAMGLAFANPLGLAAGVDRTGALIPSLNAHGFGHIEIGTITPARGYAGKLEAGRRGTPFPTAVLVMRSAGIDGVVLVSEDLDRIRAIATHLDGLTVISVGGVQTAEDVQARIAAGASLVQVHRAFAVGGAPRIRRILRGLATTSVERHP
jgi:dihydroorotate dehydrogenase